MRPISVTATVPAIPATVFTPMVRFDDWAPGQISIQVSVSAGFTSTYTVQSTLDDPDDPINPVPVNDITWVVINDPYMVTASTSRQSNFLFSPKFVRVVLSPGAAGDTITATFLQASVTPL